MASRSGAAYSLGAEGGLGEGDGRLAYRQSATAAQPASMRNIASAVSVWPSTRASTHSVHATPSANAARPLMGLIAAASRGLLSS